MRLVVVIALCFLAGASIGAAQSPEQRVRTADSLSAMNVALGTALAAEGKSKEAERAFQKALLFNGHNPQALYGLAQVYERRGGLAQATEEYSRCVLEEKGSGDGDDCSRALLRLGFASSIDGVGERVRDRFKTRVLGQSLAVRRELPAFRLSDVDGKVVTNDALKGRVAVINLWGVWCGPCVAESPEIEKFYRKFKDDTGVVFLSVSHGDSVETVRKFMRERGYTYPVLLDAGGWAPDKLQVVGYPTTYIVDRIGRIAYIRHASMRLVDEWTWIVDLLRKK